MRASRTLDPVARRRALIALMLGAVLGGLLVLGLDSMRAPLEQWLLADPAYFSQRLRLIFIVLGVMSSAPLLGVSVWLWRKGQNLSVTNSCPPGRFV